MKETKYIVKFPYTGVCQTIVRGEQVLYTNYKTFAEYKYHHAKENLKLLNEKDFKELNDNYENSMIGDWKEIAEDWYWEMLEIMPPLRWSGDSFFICEALHSNIHSYFTKWGDKYYSSLQRVTSDHSDMFDSLKDFLKVVSNEV